MSALRQGYFLHLTFELDLDFSPGLDSHLVMLPTPSTSHVSFMRVYEPAEDSFLLLDTLSSTSEKEFLQNRFSSAGHVPDHDHVPAPCPLIVEIGTGSGVVLSFVHANAGGILGRNDILTLGVDVNVWACKATGETVRVIETESQSTSARDQESISSSSSSSKFEKAQGTRKYGFYLGNAVSDLSSNLRSGSVDILIFNPPYVPTPDLPSLPCYDPSAETDKTAFEQDSHLLELSYAGGADGMETTNRLLKALPDVLSARGVAYVLLCAQNRPDEVKEGIRDWGKGWEVETVGLSGKKAGWEKLQILRIWRVPRP